MARQKVVKSKSRRKAERRENILGTLMACGPFLGFIAFSLIPVGISIYVSFTDLRGFSLDVATWVGLENYKKLLTDPNYMEFIGIAIGNTLLWMLNVPLNMGVSLFIANMLSKKLKGSTVLRTALFIPSICSSVAVVLIWQWIYDANYGVFNTILQAIGLPKVGWLTTPNMFMISCLLLSVWMYGTNIVLMQNALNNVNESLKEAARIDGASDIKVFWKIVIPQITPTLFYLLITNFVASIQEMQIMQLLASNGIGPGFRAVTLAYYTYRLSYTTYGTDGMGISSALALMVAAVCILFTRLNFWLSKKWVCYD